MSRRNGSRWPLLLLPTLLLVAACGVPISAEEITATAESRQASQQLSAIGDAAISSRASEPASQDARFAGSVTPSPISTLAALASGTPEASATAGVAAVSAAGGTPAAGLATVTGTPGPSTTPGTPVASGTTTPQPTVGVPTSDFGAQVVNLVNEYRVANGLHRLRPDPFITTASNNYARLMGERNYFGHRGPDGSSSEGRLSAAGYPGSFCGENIAAGQVSPQEAFNIWKSSAAHHAIMLAANPADIGVGYFYIADSTYKHYWVLMTGRTAVQGCPAS